MKLPVSVVRSFEDIQRVFEWLVGILGELYDKRIVYGRVSNGGVVSGGKGFTVAKLATGEYRVTFDTAFADSPAVVGSPMLGTVNSKTWQHDTETTTTSAFRCSVRDSTTSGPVDVGFHFVAVGPR